MNFIKKLFSKKNEKKVVEERSTTHYMGGYSSLFWFDFKTRTVSGHFTGVKVNDYVVCQMKTGRAAKFQITEINYMRDPSDQFFATVKDIGYADNITYKYPSCRTDNVKEC